VASLRTASKRVNQVEHEYRIRQQLNQQQELSASASTVSSEVDSEHGALRNRGKDHGKLNGKNFDLASMGDTGRLMWSFIMQCIRGMFHVNKLCLQALRRMLRSLVMRKTLRRFFKSTEQLD
jgi:hypothetical protein